MHVLVVSRGNDFSVGLIEKIKKEGHSVVCILLGEKTPSIPGGVKMFQPRSSSLEYQNICRNYPFSAVIFLSGIPNSGNIEELSLEMSVFQAVLCASQWKHVILQSDCHLFEIDPNTLKYTMIQRDRNATETQAVLREVFFKSYCMQNQIPLAILRTGYIYDPNSETLNIMALFSADSVRPPIVIHPEDDVNLLHIGDAIEAFMRCLSGTVTGIYNVCAAWWLSAGTLCSQLVDCRDKLQEMGLKPRRIVPGVDASDFYFPAVYATFKQCTDWIPLKQPRDSLHQRPCVVLRNANRSKLWLPFFNKRLKPVMETLAGFVVAAALQSLLSGVAGLGAFDMFVVFITLTACRCGVGMGFFASLLGCAAYYYNNIGTDISITDVFFLSNLWLPFIVYMLLGTGLGYRRSLQDDEAKALRESLTMQDRRYHLLLELHEDTLCAKDMLQEQIFNFEDSFGKVSQMIEQLSSLQSEKVLAAIVRVFEQALHAERIAIYALSEDGRYARFVNSSNDMDEAIQSVDLSENPQLKQAIRENTLYMNQQLSGGISYACPIVHEGRAMYFIALYGCMLQQFTLAFQNRFRVLCSLVQNSLLQALRYEQATWQQRYVDGTFVLNAEAFGRRMMLLESEDDSIKPKWLIFQVVAPAGLRELNRCITPMLRQRDFVGLGEDGCVYVVFLGARNEDGDGILRRMNSAGVDLRPISDKKELFTA